MKTARLFIHGLEGSSQGTKARFFGNHFPHIRIADFRGPLSERMEKLQQIAAHETSVMLVGSSYGGLMGAIYAAQHPEKVKKLVLLAPALSFPEFEPWAGRVIQVPTTIFHGTRDRIVLLEPVQKIAQACFSNLAFFAVQDDHFLSHTFHAMDWKGLLTL